MTIAAAADPAAAAAEAGTRRLRRGGYGRYAFGKCLGAFGSLVFMLVVNFFLFRILPGDPARTLGRGRLSTPEQVEEFNQTYGLERADPPAVRHVREEPPPRRPRLLDPLPPRRLGDPGRAVLADDAAGRDLHGAGLPDRGVAGHPGRVGPGEQVRPVHHRRLADALLDAGVVARPAADRGVRGRHRPAARHLPDRWAALRRRRSDVAGGRARHDVAPGAAGAHADPRLPRRLRADHARLADRRAALGLPDDRPRQGPARRRGSATSTRSRTRCCRRRPWSR